MFSTADNRLSVISLLMCNIKRGGYSITDQSAMHFLTFTVVAWIDLFTRQVYRDIVIENLKYCIANKGLQLSGYVIMSNHIHFLWTSANGNLSGLIRDFKSYTCKQLIQAIKEQPESRRSWLMYMFGYYGQHTNANEEFKIWTSDNHPEVIYTEKFLQTKLNYIHDNPVRAGLVSLPEQYVYSSAANYSGRKGIICVKVS